MTFHIYEVPEFMADGPRQADGKRPVQFLHVDMIPDVGMGGSTVTREEIVSMFNRKREPGKRYLVLGASGETFIIEPL